MARTSCLISPGGIFQARLKRLFRRSWRKCCFVGIVAKMYVNFILARKGWSRRYSTSLSCHQILPKNGIQGELEGPASAKYVGILSTTKQIPGKSVISIQLTLPRAVTVSGTRIQRTAHFWKWQRFLFPVLLLFTFETTKKIFYPKTLFFPSSIISQKHQKSPHLEKGYYKSYIRRSQGIFFNLIDALARQHFLILKHWII